MELIKKHVFFILGGACIFIAGVVYILSRVAGSEAVREEQPVIYAAQNAETDVGYIGADYEKNHSYVVVHIIGEVNYPGVYTIREDARVNDVVQMAGGKTEYADTERVNLAEFLRDAMQIIIPAKGEPVENIFIFSQADGAQASGGMRQGGLININTASSEELQTISGIGPVLAQNIIDFRETNGNFSTVDELIHVPRIGQVTLDRLRTAVTVQ
ncbi:MAG: helix-hairpin-helix domain-containing protein [Defluviitaleaceae bacterium]|nr:helix-hairpin-helix domain-containing protein [Defluviitaleaceae bacterium]